MLQQNNKPHNNTSIHKPQQLLYNKDHHQIISQTHNHIHLNQQHSNQHFSHQSLYETSYKKHTQQQGFGFEHQQEQQVIIVQKQQQMNQTVSISKKFIPYRIKQPKIKLTFVSKQRQLQPLSATLKKQYENKSLQMKKNIQCRSLIINAQKILLNCVIKVKRSFVGDNIVYHNYSSQQNKKIKFQIISSGNKIIYQLIRQTSSYAHISLIKQKQLNHSKINSTNKISNTQNYISNTQNYKSNKKDSTTNTKDNSLNIKNKYISTNTNNQHNLLQTVPFLNNNNLLIQSKDNFFLDNPINQLLKSKIKQSFIHHKKKQHIKHHNQPIQFDSQFQSANLQFVAKINHFIDQSSFSKQSQKSTQNNLIQQYNLYLRNDTNTHGHQNWFYFRLKNNSKQSKRIKLNIVNLKRNLNLIKQGQKIYARIINPFKSQWYIAGQQIQLKQNRNTTVYKCKVRILSFQFQTQPQTQYQISLLPPYTYSQMLNDIQTLKFNKYAKIQTLTYSLIGLAIPIITFTNPQIEDTNKQVILISSRIHPGQTVASFITKGIIQSFSNDIDSTQIQEFLNSTIIKVIPIINPDGVVFGNFRTNYLGYDLNRSFHTEDQITNPQIVALKQLGKKLKGIHAQKFHTFIDLHGHSSEKNIFTYGPDFQNGHQNFYKARLLPKLLNSKSPYFKYGSCSFKLEDYKSSTARAFFLNLGVNAFTIESSYAIYQTQQGQNEILTQKQWLNFGQTLSDSFSLISRLNKTHNIKNQTQLKRAISLTQQENLHLISVLKRQMKKQQNSKKHKKIIHQKQQIDSDGQDEVEDLDASERQDIEKKLVQNTARNVVLPKVFKPSILYPTVTPKIFNIGQTNGTSYKILYTRRNRYQSIKMPANTYLHSFQGVQSLKPKARNIKVQRKIQW